VANRLRFPAPPPEAAALGTAPIPKHRYTSVDFAHLEWERMWPRVWLLAGIEADVAAPGDWFTFEIGPESILVARDHRGALHAHHNVCLHRGNRLCEPGRGRASTFSCRYHAWEWDLDGRLRRATDADTFPGGLPPDLRLREVRLDTWGGFVWVTMDPATSLAEYLGPVRELLDPYRLTDYALTDDVTLELECNWKTCVDAFNEVYHVQGTHPEILDYTDDVEVPITLFERHSSFVFSVGRPSPRLGTPAQIPTGLRDLVMAGAGLDSERFSGSVADVRPAVLSGTRRLLTDLGMDVTRLTDAQMIDDHHVTIFPNVTFNLHARGFWLFRHRPHPTDPNRMYFDFQDWQRWSDALGPRPARPTLRHDTAGGTSLGIVLDQDLYNLPRVQAGMRSRAFEGLLLSSQEVRIRHFHDVLDRYVRPESGRRGSLS
jgi:phenylpropionate dioxygenase-like ring-hydroxylating dioxygenase large terminal subunit